MLSTARGTLVLEGSDIATSADVLPAGVLRARHRGPRDAWAARPCSGRATSDAVIAARAADRDAAHWRAERACGPPRSERVAGLTSMTRRRQQRGTPSWGSRRCALRAPAAGARTGVLSPSSAYAFEGHRRPLPVGLLAGRRRVSPSSRHDGGHFGSARPAHGGRADCRGTWPAPTPASRPTLWRRPARDVWIRGHLPAPVRARSMRPCSTGTMRPGVNAFEHPAPSGRARCGGRDAAGCPSASSLATLTTLEVGPDCGPPGTQRLGTATTRPPSRATPSSLASGRWQPQRTWSVSGTNTHGSTPCSGCNVLGCCAEPRPSSSTTTGSSAT